MSLPAYEFLSAPLPVVTLLHLVTLTLHFAAMNFLLGGVIIVLHAAVRRRWDDPTLVKYLRWFPGVMAATVTLGVAPLLFLQLVYPRQVYAAAIVSGWFWLAIVAVVIVAYYALYRAAWRGEKHGTVSRAALSLALLGLLYVSLVYSSVFSMAERPALLGDLYAANQSGTVWNPAVGHYGLRWLHMVLGAITVGGFCVGVLGQRNPATFKTGKIFFLVGMIVASLAGVLYLVSLYEILPALMRGPAIWALTVSIMLSLGALHFFFKQRFLAAGLMLFGSMLGMVYTRHVVRLLQLADSFDPATWPVAPQWGPFGLFLVCFVLALAVLGYLLRLVLKTAAPS